MTHDDIQAVLEARHAELKAQHTDADETRTLQAIIWIAAAALVGLLLMTALANADVCTLAGGAWFCVSW